MRFAEYFPNRELGIILFKKDNIDLAIDYLEKSMNAEPTQRAKDFLVSIGQVKHDRSLAVVDDQAPEISVLAPNLINEKIFQPVPNNQYQITLIGKAKDPGGCIQSISQ